MTEIGSTSPSVALSRPQLTDKYVQGAGVGEHGMFEVEFGAQPQADVRWGEELILLGND